MNLAPWIAPEYWSRFQVTDEDLEFLYQYLLEQEVPQKAETLAQALVRERIRREQQRIEERWQQSEAVYMPKHRYEVGQRITFPALGWVQGEVVGVRPGYHPEHGPFEVIRVRLEDGQEKEFAANFPDHVLNQPPRMDQVLEFQPERVWQEYGPEITRRVEQALEQAPGFIRLSDLWFLKELMVPIEEQYLLVADAVLDVAGGGPLRTEEIAQHLDLPEDLPKPLVLFSLAYALQQDDRFDEVGPSGLVQWYLKRAEPQELWEPPRFLRYQPIPYERDVLPPELRDLETQLHDELAPPPEQLPDQGEEMRLALLYPHWRAGTLPLDAFAERLFPTAYTARRIFFHFVDDETGKRFPGWVVRDHRYVYGLREWYEEKDVIPGTIIQLKRGRRPNEVLIRVESRRPMREWIRTAQVDERLRLSIVMENRPVRVRYDDRMAFYIPNVDALDRVWVRIQDEKRPFEDLVMQFMRELRRLTLQRHVHAVELYAAVNLVYRVPPGPVFALLVSRPWFEYVGDLYFRLRQEE